MLIYKKIKITNFFLSGIMEGGEQHVAFKSLCIVTLYSMHIVIKTLLTKKASVVFLLLLSEGTSCTAGSCSV